MISLKCKRCAGEMSIDLKGELACPYCGSKEHLSDMEYQNYRNFRSNMLQYLRAASDAAADAADDTFLWNYHDTVVLYTASGTKININYLFYAKEDGVDMYVAKDSVIYVFQKNEKYKADKMLQGIQQLRYPSAALKNLSKYVPTVKASYELDDGGMMLAVSKPENAYPVYAFGSIKPEHAAWIVSRLENICCVLEFSEIEQNGITINSVFINTRTHEAFLYGGWWNWCRKGTTARQNDLYAVRKTADLIMGEYRDKAPAEFHHFIQGRPAPDAYEDFEKWDEVIMKGFGGHKFIPF